MSVSTIARRILPNKLAPGLPAGHDVYYENVGGKVFDGAAAVEHIGGRVPVCGLVSGYNATGLPDGPDRSPLLMATILKNASGCRALLSADYGHRLREFQQQMGRWVQEGKLNIANS